MRENKNSSIRPLDISVLMSVYNGEEFLAEAIDSILNQSFQNFEFVIVNDGSTDDSERILNYFAKKCSQIKLIKNNKNLGLTKSLNIGLKKCAGKYIARMDADDISHPERLATQFNFMEDNPQFAVTGTGMKTTGIGKTPPCTPDEIKVYALFDNPLYHPTVIFRTSYLRKNKIWYNEAFRTAQDYELWVRILNQMGKEVLSNIPDQLVTYRHHSNRIGAKHSAEQLTNADRIRLNEFKRLFKDSVELDSELFIHICRGYHNNISNKMEALNYFNKVISLFNEIVEMNKHSSQYEENALNKLLALKLYVISRKLSIVSGVEIYKQFFASSFSQFKNISFASHVKFLLESILQRKL